MSGDQFRKWLEQAKRNTLIMGILNVTPDSFSDGGRFNELEKAISQVQLMEKNGADIIDIGGESTRPGAVPVSVDEEINRTVPVIEEIRKISSITISIDTYKSKVAKMALSAGADFVNDISGLTFDEGMINTVKEFEVPVVIMHIQGTPLNMQKNTTYNDVVKDLLHFFSIQIQKALDFGINFENIIIDPGIGFGKRPHDNFTLIRRLKELSVLGCPILIGPSRKSFIGLSLDLPPDERMEGTLATVTASILNGASIVRVHDVNEVKRTVIITEKILNTGTAR
ncbi:MAG: dihydropteroate synthase [Candidatus Marinimicrobia bacterium]|jgi:dihydropteroate synthase|nr:dihydropteroate synthase [Candidatus Neomarinimicrobiota bacterium]|tara:strand:- start:306 stop:1154 length:849 start_codon:yes stop_codon:yes gene_type:complete